MALDAGGLLRDNEVLMARPLRIEYAGAVYHVMARGNQGRAIFRDDRDRECFVETLGAAGGKTGWRIHAFVLLGNHYHLLVETPEANLVAGMKWLQGTFTQRFNGRHRLRGHLFQGRYRAVPVEAENAGYLEAVSSYIHLNPARVGLIEIGRDRLRSYRWSSYPWYVGGGRGAPVWLERRRVMGALGLAPQERRRYEKRWRGQMGCLVMNYTALSGRKVLIEERVPRPLAWAITFRAFSPSVAVLFRQRRRRRPPEGRRPCNLLNWRIWLGVCLLCGSR